MTRLFALMFVLGLGMPGHATVVTGYNSCLQWFYEVTNFSDRGARFMCASGDPTRVAVCVYNSNLELDTRLALMLCADAKPGRVTCARENYQAGFSMEQSAKRCNPLWKQHWNAWQSFQ